MIVLPALALGLVVAGMASATPETLRLGTWNMQWLMTPETFDALAPHCLAQGQRAKGSDRALYCDLVPKARWGTGELRRLRDFAAEVDLDVIALQEVDGAEAAARIFPGYDFCFTRRSHVQNVGFAIRRGISHRCNADYRALGLRGGDVRWGADLTLFPGQRRETRLLTVHLKSGCHHDPLSERRRDCHMLQDQVPLLERWIDQRAREGKYFAVLGDFNRRFDRETGSARDARGKTIELWAEIDDGSPAEADLTNAGDPHRPFACIPDARARTAIDHIVLSRGLARALMQDSWRAWPYPDKGRWPDHCLISVELRP